MYLYNELIGGQWDKHLACLDQDYVIARPDVFADLDYSRGLEKAPDNLVITRYFKRKAFVKFNKITYFREFLVPNQTDYEIAIKRFKRYFNPIFIK
ncbi:MULTISPECIES: hypothetical protein [unclassified Acinetobacter]|uniref:hypothetical protein n=1 Tax=unclassified Acinetobacter TaxID=196816 RepID=UPI002D1F56FE|nr:MULTISPECIES: hypothetical protein [unclassified Acinetobacter]MEB3793677.1 hypothetical protein [Acinetobacter sp. IK24]MEB3812953.1 hypothetical protein [Acinetobacter sp. IK22]MEB3832073.1 hypothetical protein [Acinetobacter sp. IK23]MEB3835934.1 hypothetical protein [Acinetobacter sp. IK25]